MLFARWQHHLRFCSGFPYAPLKAMVTKISKWSRIPDSFRITPKIEPLVDFAIPDITSKFQKDPFINFWVILLTHKQTNKQSGKNITSLAEVNIAQHLAEAMDGRRENESNACRLQLPSAIHDYCITQCIDKCSLCVRQTRHFFPLLCCWQVLLVIFAESHLRGPSVGLAEASQCV